MKKLTYFLVLLLICISLTVMPVLALVPTGEVTIETLSEYQNYVETTELPDYFIFYEQLSFLGEFRSFTHCDRTTIPEYNYRYTLTSYLDESIGYIAGISVYSEEKFSERMEYYEHPNSSWKTYCYSDNLIYFYRVPYREGEITSIAIKVHNAWLLLAVGPGLFANDSALLGKQPPTEYNTRYLDIVKKLLNKETVDEAYAEFVTQVTGSTPPSQSKPTNTMPIDTGLTGKVNAFDFGCKSVISGGVMTAVICGGAALVLLPKKKKR